LESEPKTGSFFAKAELTDPDPAVAAINTIEAIYHPFGYARDIVCVLAVVIYVEVLSTMVTDS